MNATSTVFTKASSALAPQQLQCFSAPNNITQSASQQQYRAYAYYSSLPPSSKYNGLSLSTPSLQQIRSHFLSTQPALSPLDKTPLSHTSNNYKLATTLLQLQEPILHHSHTPPSNASPQLGSTGDDSSPSLEPPPISSTNSLTQIPYPSSPQFMFQTSFAQPQNTQSCWNPNTTWPYIPLPGHQDYKTNSCHVCGKTYARLSTLRSHLKSHSGEKPYQCSICQKSFTQAANLTAHLRTHSGEKPFKCPVCHRGFSQSSSVTTHMRTHSGDRPYKCNVCNKGFADSSTLTKHYRTHTGEKPYQCKICEARFSQSGNLNRHMRTHRHHYINSMDNMAVRHL